MLCSVLYIHWVGQGLVKGAILCFRNLYFYFRHGESTSTASKLTSPASQKSKDFNKVPLLLKDLDSTSKRVLLYQIPSYHVVLNQTHRIARHLKEQDIGLFNKMLL